MPASEREPSSSNLEGSRLPVGDPVPAGETPSRPGSAERCGRYVRLRPLEPEGDVGELYAGSHGEPQRERLWTYMAYGPFASREAMCAWLRACAGSEDPRFLCVTDATTGRRLGMASFLAIRQEMRVLELGHIWYLPEAQRTRANTETAYLMLREAFEERGYRRVEWKCDALNAASRRAALRLGFGFEGVFRQHMIVKDRNRDTAWYALLDRDWPQVRVRIERWLASDPETTALSTLA